MTPEYQAAAVSHWRGRGVVVASDGNHVALGGDMAELVMVEIVS